MKQELEYLERLRKRFLIKSGVDIFDKSRKENVVFVRKAFCKKAFDEIPNYSVLARFLNRNHATIIHHVKDMNHLLTYNDYFKKRYNRLIGIDGQGLGSDYFYLSIGAATIAR